MVPDINQRTPVHAVTTTADLHVPCAAYLASLLGLPSLTLQAATRVRNKHAMRVHLGTHYPAANPRFSLVQSISEVAGAVDSVGLPLVAKPPNGDGSDDVQIHHGMETLESHVRDLLARRFNSGGQPLGPGVLLEQYVEGNEFSVETISVPGRPPQLMGVTRKEVWGEPFAPFIEIGHSFPVTGTVADQLKEVVFEVLRLLELKVGTIHTECKITADGHVRIIEVNPRLAGGKIGSHMIKVATGSSPIVATVDVALGRDVLWRPSRQGGAALRYILPDCPGYFQGLGGVDTALAMPGVVDVFQTVAQGTFIERMGYNAQRVACILTSGEDATQARTHAITAAEQIVVHMSTIA
jgi:cysteine synthase A